MPSLPVKPRGWLSVHMPQTYKEESTHFLLTPKYWLLVCKPQMCKGKDTHQLSNPECWLLIQHTSSRHTRKGTHSLSKPKRWLSMCSLQQRKSTHQLSNPECWPSAHRTQTHKEKLTGCQTQNSSYQYTVTRYTIGKALTFCQIQWWWSVWLKSNNNILSLFINTC